MLKMIDLWPASIEVSKIIPPVTILREQATMLGKKTKNLIKAEVKEFDQESSFQRFDFGYVFYIVAPTLYNYRFPLLSIYHNVEPYPLYVHVQEEIFKEISQKFEIMANIHIKVKSEDEFYEVLRAIFNSSKAKRVISILLAQSAPGFNLSSSDDEN